MGRGLWRLGVKIKQAYGAVRGRKKTLRRQKLWKQNSCYRELNSDALGLKRRGANSGNNLG